jgi:hypothetical protein
MCFEGCVACDVSIGAVQGTRIERKDDFLKSRVFTTPWRYMCSKTNTTLNDPDICIVRITRIIRYSKCDIYSRKIKKTPKKSTEFRAENEA